ncbi:hypothetical protein BDF20DRAFT_911862 [Mycotypha africana]|uniref:uncharacterized protein n=1 Tax=Mycotypha africana TaxID=64632 RepID=UPI0023004A54|nr:uncharacterized protein BDF20DRAFT_911862 [Mycotypha africana]KAI8981587.1 hypothetical protein BDF20DRAFT_911862 [Mycotypha africana]
MSVTPEEPSISSKLQQHILSAEIHNKTYLKSHPCGSTTSAVSDDKLMKAKQIFQSSQHHYLTESQFSKVTEVCQLPFYMNIAFFQTALAFTDSNNIGSAGSNSDISMTTTYLKRQEKELRQEDEQATEAAITTAESDNNDACDQNVISFPTFERCWSYLTAKCKNDQERLFFNILLLQRTNKGTNETYHHYLIPEDFLPVLEDIIFNHPALQFLVENPTFQEKYIETVICRLFYDAKCPLGKMSFTHYRRCKFTEMIQRLTPETDLNTTKDCFSYKHFYVLYCKFWMLDEDHDLIINQIDLQSNYNDGVLPTKIVQQIMQNGQIPAFKRVGQKPSREKALQYFDFIWFFLSEIDKSTPVAIEYWFRCMDSDGDGIITTFDLLEYWAEQDRRLRATMLDYLNEEYIHFDDLIRQMNDLILPKTPGQFCLSDLKKNGIIAERFFDTFLNLEKFQLHDSSQNLIRISIQAEKEKRRRQLLLLQTRKEKEDDSSLDIILHHQQTANNSSDMYLRDKQIQHYQQQQMFETFILGSWSDYAEIEYELLIVDEEQCESITDENNFSSFDNCSNSLLKDCQDINKEEEEGKEAKEDEYCYYQHHAITRKDEHLVLKIIEAPTADSKSNTTTYMTNLKQGKVLFKDADSGDSAGPERKRIWLALEDESSCSLTAETTRIEQDKGNYNDDDTIHSSNSLLKGLIWPTIKESY